MDNTAINLPDVLAEVTAAFERYEHALFHNKVDVLDALFLHSPHTVRDGATARRRDGVPVGHRCYPRPLPPRLARELRHTRITTYGHDCATASTGFARDGHARSGRPQQTWVRMPGQGWCVVAAHVSLMN